MSVIGNDSRQATTDYTTFPISVVTTVDITSGGANYIGSGIMISPNHVLTASHNDYNTSTNTAATALRTGLSSAEDALTTRSIGNTNDPAANVTNVNHLKNYDTTEGVGDDIALFTILDSPITASQAIGLVSFNDIGEADGLAIDTAGYPGDSANGYTGRTLVVSPGTVDSPGEITTAKANGRIFYSSDVDTAGGQSGSGIWTTLDGDSTARVVGVHTNGTGNSNPLINALLLRENSGTAITADVYDAIAAQMEADFTGTLAQYAADLPENAIIGSDGGFFSSGDEFVLGSWRKERILSQDGEDRIVGGGADDRIDGGDGVDQALYGGLVTDYTITITDATDPDRPDVQISHTGGTTTDGVDTLENVEYAVFQFEDADNRGDTGFGIDDDSSQFFVPLLADLDDPTKLRDGEKLNVGQDVTDVNGNLIGSMSAEIPAFMFDGDVNYSLTIGAEESIVYNFVYVVDSSGSMGGSNITETKAAYTALTQSLIDQGIADRSQFAVVDFDSSARLISGLDAQGAIDTVNGLVAGGGTNFGRALTSAEEWFESLGNITTATNIAYFLSDGFGTGASSNLQLVNEDTDPATVDVRAFGIGSGANLNSLNTIDSGNAVLLTNAADLTDAFAVSGVDRSTIKRVDVKLDGTVIDTIAPDEFADEALSLKYEGTIDNLAVTITAENKITFDLVFNDGTPVATIETKITTGQTELRQTTSDGTEVVAIAVNHNDYIVQGSKESVSANELNNSIEINGGTHEIRGNGGDDKFVVNGGSTVIDGGSGIDTVVFSTTQAEAGAIGQSGDLTTVGTDHTFFDVEYIEFTDARISTANLSSVPVLTLDSTTVVVSETDAGTTQASFKAKLSSASTAPVTLNFVTRDDTATAAADYTAADSSVVFAAGETEKTITFDILDDSVVEGFERFLVDLSIAGDATFDDNSTATTVQVGIDDDDTDISFSTVGDDNTIVEGSDGGTTAYTLTLDRTGDLSGSDTIDWSVDLTTTAGKSNATADDFANGVPSGTVTFLAGEATKDITIEIAADTVAEGDEDFDLSFTQTAGDAILSVQTSTFTITDDDASPTNPILYAVDSFEFSKLADYDGNTFGEADQWKQIGIADIELDGDSEYLFTNSALGRWATIGPDAPNVVDYDQHGLNGDTRVVGIYIDPLVESGVVVKDSDLDSQRRFQNDLEIDNILHLGSGDYDADGLQQLYFKTADGTAYLNALMHADGNIQYANYQSEEQMVDYLTDLGFTSEVWADWLTA